MGFLGRWTRRLAILLRHGTVERSMDAEMLHHIDCATAERIAEGMTPEAARLSALRDFGGMERFKEEGRDARGTRLVEDTFRDLHHGARSLRRSPGYIAAIALTFALGIGATTSIFSVVYGVLLRPLPYAEPDRLVALFERNVSKGRERNVVSLANFLAWREWTRAFSGMAALMPRSATLSKGSVPERIAGAEVSAGFFGLLGVHPALGRDFQEADTDAVILSDSLWKSRFAADPSVLGMPVSIDGAPRTVVGVMPPRFDPPRFGWLGAQELWFPFTATEQARSWGRFLLVVARLKPDVALDSAQADLEAVAGVLEKESPNNKGWTASVIDLKTEIVGDARAELLALLAAVLLLLSLAIINAGALTLSLVRQRRHELAIRRALGATEGRLFRLLFVQSALPGAAGTLLGLLLAIPGMWLLLLILPADVPRSAGIVLDRPVVVVMLGAAILSTALFGSVAAVRGRSTSGSRLQGEAGVRISRRGPGAALVAGEVALALALGVMALLTARSFASLRSIDLGFEADRVLAARVARPPSAGAEENARAFFEALLERFRAVPGVVSAALISARPCGGAGVATTVTDPRKPDDSGAGLVAAVRYTDAAIFRTLRIPFVEGSPFDDDPRPRTPAHVVVTETLARSMWPGERAVGRPLRIALFGGLAAEVAGVVRDVRLADSRTPPVPTVFLSAARFPMDTMDVMIRSDGEPGMVIPTLRAALASLDPAVPLYGVETMKRIVDMTLSTDRFSMSLIGAFAVCALLMAGVGIFGVFAGEAAARRREIGIRLALGGTSWGILALFLRRATYRALVGIVAGSVMAVALSHAMKSLLFGISPGDPAALLAGAAIVLMLAVGASLAPAWQALRHEPLAALREE